MVYCAFDFVYNLIKGCKPSISIILYLISTKMSYSQIDYSELANLAELAGIHAIPRVHRILIELLSLQVSPEDIYVLLRQISPIPQQRKRLSSASKPESTGQDKIHQ